MKSVSGMVSGVVSKPIPIKNGPRAGSTGYVHSATVDGHKINFGFNKPMEGQPWSGLVSDAPNRFGEYEVDRGSKPKTVGSFSTLNGTKESQSPEVSGTTPRSVRDNGAYSKLFPIPKNDHATSICRQSALKAAVETVALADVTSSGDADHIADEVLTIANKYAKWTTGQLEVEEAEKVINALSAATSHVA